MDRFKKFLVDNYFWIVLILFCGVYLNDCSQQKTNKSLVKQNRQLIIQNQELIQQLDTIKNDFVKKNELKLFIKIGGYEVVEMINQEISDVARSRANERAKQYKKRIDELENHLNNR